MKAVNLSSRPFRNTRPVVRVAIALWVLGGLLLIDNVWRYGSHAAGFSSTRSELEATEAKIEAAEARIEELEAELAGLGVDEHNQARAYLNTLIARRTFPWSLLFEDLEKIVPPDVRLTRVSPKLILARKPGVRQTREEAEDGRSRGARSRGRGLVARTAAEDRVHLQLLGSARSGDELLTLVDALYASPSFESPVLEQESRDQRSSELRFQLDVIYLLELPETETEKAETAEAETLSPETMEPETMEPETPEGELVEGEPVEGEGETASAGNEAWSEVVAENEKTLEREEPRADPEEREPARRETAVASPRSTVRERTVPSTPRPEVDGTAREREGSLTGVMIGSPVQGSAGDPGTVPSTTERPPAAPTPTQPAPEPSSERPIPEPPSAERPSPAAEPEPPAPEQPDASATPRLERPGGGR